MRGRSGLALTVLALATLGSTLLPWTRICQFGVCGDVTTWSSPALGLLAATLVVCEALPLLSLGKSRAFLSAVLAFAVAATIGIFVGFELTEVEGFSAGTVWIGTWVGLALAALLVLTGAARLRGHIGDVARKRPNPEWLDTLFLGGGGFAFATTFLAWVTPTPPVTGGPNTAWAVAGFPGYVFGLLALAVVGIEAMRLAGMQPARQQTLVPATIVLACSTAVFGVVSVVYVLGQFQTLAAHTAYGAWLALAACAVLVTGAVLRRHKFVATQPI